MRAAGKATYNRVLTPKGMLPLYCRKKRCHHSEYDANRLCSAVCAELGLLRGYEETPRACKVLAIAATPESTHTEF